MIYSISNKKDAWLSKKFNKAMLELGEFYEVDWNDNKPDVILVPNRKIIDLIRGYKTEDWVVGWSENNKVYLLDKKNFNIQSSHTYSTEDYYKLLKHELSHCFYSSIFNNYKTKPVWLNEGLAIYLSDMLSIMPKPKSFKRFLNFFEYSSAEIYEESGFFIEFLVNTFGKDKLIDLLKEISKNNSEEAFKLLFKKIYDFDLNYAEINNRALSYLKV